MNNNPKPKSPFFINEAFLSPLLCEQVVDALECVQPDVDQDGYPQHREIDNEHLEKIIFDKFQDMIPSIEEYYNIQHRGTKPIHFHWYPQAYPGDEKITCENARFHEGKWYRVKDADLTAIIFLSDYNDNVPFDSEYEVYGGKYEFPQHDFGFNAQRGTMIIYPSDPHFLNRVADVKAGDLFLAKFHIGTMEPFIYDPQQFPGTYETWFS